MSDYDNTYLSILIRQGKKKNTKTKVSTFRNALKSKRVQTIVDHS